MDCPNCKARGFAIEMLYEDITSYHAPVVCESKADGRTKKYPAAHYICPHCLDEFGWSMLEGLREIIE